MINKADAPSSTNKESKRMGQYHQVFNLDKKERLHPHRFDDGLKLMEFGMSSGGTLTGLTILLATSNGRGGGDFRPANKQDEIDVVGRWAGDRIAICGDYGEPTDKANPYGSTTTESEQEYKDISDMVFAAMKRAGEFGGNKIGLGDADDRERERDAAAEKLAAMLERAEKAEGERDAALAAGSILVDVNQTGMLDHYQALAMRTENRTKGYDVTLTTYALGIAGEAGEVADLIKKVIGHDHPLDVDKLTKELGDVLWYVAGLAKLLKLKLSVVAAKNIDKLRARYPDGFDVDRSMKRIES